MTDARASGPAVVSVHYYPEYLKSSVGHVLDLCARTGAGRCVIVANQAAVAPALASAFAGYGFVEDVVLHDNSGLEFGAYQTGLDRLLRATEPDWTLIVNDTFARHECHSRPMRRRLVEAIQTTRDLDTPIVVGAVDSLPRSYTLFGSRTHRWIRSNVFALNRGALRALGGTLRCPESETLVAGGTSEATFFAEGVDPVLSDHLRRFLFHPESDPAWYRAAPLGTGNAAAFAGKARSILHEKYLSARLDAAGAIFVDTKPLHDFERVIHRVDAMAFAIARRRRNLRR